MDSLVDIHVFGQFVHDDLTRFGEVQYFMRLAVPVQQAGELEDGQKWLAVAVIKLYSAPDQELLSLSSQVVASCKLLDELLVVNVKKIFSVVGMVPHTPTLPSGVSKSCFFLVKKPGLDLSDLGVPYPPYEEYEVDENVANEDELE